MNQTVELEPDGLWGDREPPSTSHNSEKAEETRYICLTGSRFSSAECCGGQKNQPS